MPLEDIWLMIISLIHGIINKMEKDNKKKLFGLLKQALDSEEKAVPIYNHHLESAVFWTGLSEDKAKELREVLRLLAKESIEHKIAVEKMLLKLCEER